VSALIFVVLLIVGIFAFDVLHRWWKQNEWKRRWRDPPGDD
jgi:hypothetical protein